MDNQIELELLNKEYQDLLIRIKKVRDRILKISGIDPASEDDKAELNTDYPFKKTISEKIKYVLDKQRKKLTVAQITLLMKQHEPKISKQTVSQMCSNMGKKKEIGVELGQKNLYYFETKKE